MTEQTATPRRARRAIPAWWYAAAFAAVYLLAVCTPFGQRAENALMGGPGGEQAWSWGWSGKAYGSFALPPMDVTVTPTVVAGLVVLMGVALVRRRWVAGLVGAAVVVATVGSVEVLAKAVLPRPELVGAPDMLTAASFPSGHAAVPAALTLGAALVAGPRSRPYVLTAGLVWLALTAGAVQALYDHRPSDVLGATLLGCFWYRLAVRLVPSVAPAGDGALPAWVSLAFAAAGAVVGGMRTDSVAGPLVFAVTAFGCAVLVRSVTESPRAPFRLI
ncbi:phosphatase PAP2 family protein [Pseudosporangium ferrugineum]|uniref:PAP2 superfamily protein n=1 Tax=Pseudosporangium ferrugineum TaxID=439699 RepID=A0A2T0RI04_9ACTN|nr:phosphatase PAP2 family protein [Pseudosporangium ferrugineum]PRY20788.1 PAP2 superfamily protein [Pseudosporangium ferrugineum]